MYFITFSFVILKINNDWWNKSKIFILHNITLWIIYYKFNETF